MGYDIMINTINGSIAISTMHNGYRVHQTYYGYSEKEAKAKFRQYLISLGSIK